ncbi:MAG TPA: HDOD domain-containing protein [Steroidobacteraceae bacterium]|nr:HDOD domain-containing protein [Steroidobacteraceae bacterium]
MESQSTVAFGFIRSLAEELSGGHVDLPSFPEIALQVRRILSDPNTRVEQIVRVVGSEPALAARLLRIANSAAINRSGKSVTDLRTAIARIGHNMVRSASISFSMNQIRRANTLASLAPHLNDLWERSTYVAAYAYVLARTCTRVNPDEAMLTGMMHGIGKLYILTRAIGHPELFASEDVLKDIINDWYPSIGKAILENWKFSESMARAVGQEDFSRTDLDSPDLTDVVGIAMLMVAYGTDIAGLEQTLEELPAAKRLGMNQSKTLAVMQDSAAEVTALSQALAD